MKELAKLIGLVVMLAALFAIGPLVFMLAWNGVAHSAFGAPALGFWQSFGCTLILGFIGRSCRSESKR